jgi:Protein of unknown function (DUF3604)
LQLFKSATLTPEEILAGDSDEFVIKLIVGAGYTAGKSSRIIFDFSCTLGTSCPTRQVNEAAGYVEAYLDNPLASYELRCWDIDKQYFVDAEHPPTREAMRMAVLDIHGALQAGDVIELHWGETTGGFGPGTKASTVIPRSDYRPWIDIRYFDSPDKGLPDHGGELNGIKRPEPDGEVVRLEYTIKPRDLRRLRLIRNATRSLLVPLDRFGNIPVIDDVEALVSADSALVANKYGTFDADKNVTISSKITNYRENVSMEHVFEGMNIYWGDLHSHSKYSIDCARRSGMDMSPGDLMDFARHRSGLDFVALTDHHIPHADIIRHLGQEKWDATMGDCASRNQPGEFVVFPGFEFTDSFGDICLIFKDIPEYSQISDPKQANVSDFYRVMKDNIMAIAHLHSPGHMPEGTWREGIDAISPVLEVYSDHGSYERQDIYENGRAYCKAFRADRNADYFLNNGYKYGFVANSDDHKGHIGVNGLTAVYAKELTREAIWEAYFKRQVYATTNARIRLLFTANGKMMGSELAEVGQKEFHVDVTGDNRLKKIELFRNCELFKIFIPDGNSFTTDFSVPSTGSDNWYVRVTQVDSHIAYSSPVWFVGN